MSTQCLDFGRPIIQVAGFRSLAEVQLAVDAGVDWLGFPFVLGYHQEDCTIDAAKEMINALPSAHTPVLITYLDKADEIVALCATLGVRHVQLHGPICEAELQQCRVLAPDLFIIKSLVVGTCRDDELILTLQQLEPFVDAFITDTFDATTGATGATGKTHDWSVSKACIQHAQKPVILAGGLTADNVYQAICEVKPWSVDVHTGVEDDAGAKDWGKLKAFVEAAREGFMVSA